MSKIGVIAPSGQVPKVEFKLGIERIRQEGFSVDVHPQCFKSHLFFAGEDQVRAQAFLDYANDNEHSILWCARGGHGAIRLLPLLEKYSKEKGIPKQKKLLIGYSDITALMEYVRKAWGWSTLHAPMPSLRQFSLLPDSDWNLISKWIQRCSLSGIWGYSKLKFWANPPQQPLKGKLVGGNLTVWNCMTGTRFQPDASQCFLFFEDVDESLYRIDRLVQQLYLTGSLDKVKAILLGNFLRCKDSSPPALKAPPSARARKRVLEAPKPSELKNLRKILKDRQTLQQIFSELGDRLKIPVAYGLPVGHGPEVSPLPLGANYRLDAEGDLSLENWDWTP